MELSLSIIAFRRDDSVRLSLSLSLSLARARTGRTVKLTKGTLLLQRARKVICPNEFASSLFLSLSIAPLRIFDSPARRLASHLDEIRIRNAVA
jgi:hypothetical protein